jgi:hypothetical protein
MLRGGGGDLRPGMVKAAGGNASIRWGWDDVGEKCLRFKWALKYWI